MAVSNEKLNYQLVSSVLFGILTLILIVSYYTNEYTWSSQYQRLFSFKKSASNDKQYDFSIVFIETNDKRDFLNERELCSIESAARHNPNARVRAFSVNAQIKQTYLFEAYPNIEYVKMSLSEVFNNTPLHDWWVNERLHNKYDFYRFAHLSDALRILLLYKYAGVYLDLDMVTLDSYGVLPNYTAVTLQYMDAFSNSFITAAKPNDPYYYECLKEFAETYDPESWAGNGLHLLERVMYRYCNVTSFYPLLSNVNNFPNNIREETFREHRYACSVYVLPFYVSTPLHWRDSGKLFQKGELLDPTVVLYSKSIHFNNKETSSFVIRRNDRTIIEYLFKEHCPLVYKNEIKN